MKSVIRGTFGIVFVNCIMLSVANLMFAIVILPLWTLGFISSENEALHYSLVFQMLTCPVAIILCFFKPKFMVVKENTQGFPSWLISITDVIYVRKMHLLQIYNEYYTSVARVFYFILNVYLWIFTKTHLSLVYDLDARIYLLAGSLFNLILVAFICAVYGITNIPTKRTSPQ